MSGHSKWSKIKRQKGATDQKRGALFSKLTKAITIAAKNGTDPSMNFQLRIAVDKAKQANMPKDNIDRAIKKAEGAEKMEEITYEAYGPGGTAFLIEAATDNKNRAVTEIKTTLIRNGGKLAESGSVSYLFKRVGQIVIDTENYDEAELAAIDAGAEDIEEGDKQIFIYTDPKKLEEVRKALDKAGYSSTDVGLEWHPSSSVEITEKDLAEKIIIFSGLLEDLNDVTKVSGNFEISDNLLE